MEVGVETEKDRHFCHGYRKLTLLVQLCVLFATRFCSMGVEDQKHLLLLRFQNTQTVPGAEEHRVPPSETNRIACLKLKAVLYSFMAGNTPPFLLI